MKRFIEDQDEEELDYVIQNALSGVTEPDTPASNDFSPASWPLHSDTASFKPNSTASFKQNSHVLGRPGSFNGSSNTLGMNTATTCRSGRSGRTRPSEATVNLKDNDDRTWFQRHMEEKHMMRGLQVVMFMLTFGLADSLADKHKWEERTLQTLTTSLVYTLICIIMGLTIPYQVPIFLQLTALPPYVDRDNLEAFLQILVDDHIITGPEGQQQVSAVSRYDVSTGLGSRSVGQNGQKSALVLAEVICNCKNFEDVAQVKQQLIQRLSHKGLGAEDLDMSPWDSEFVVEVDRHTIGALPWNGKAKGCDVELDCVGVAERKIHFSSHVT
jgi:hypothetical protein